MTREEEEKAREMLDVIDDQTKHARAAGRRHAVEPLIQEHDPHHLQRPKLVREKISPRRIVDIVDPPGSDDLGDGGFGEGFTV